MSKIYELALSSSLSAVVSFISAFCGAFFC